MSKKWYESKLKELAEEERKKLEQKGGTTTMNDRHGVAESEATKKDKETSRGAKGKWICDVCRNATFDSYTEAVAHEYACRDSKLLASSGKKKQNRCNRELKSLSYSHFI